MVFRPVANLNLIHSYIHAKHSTILFLFRNVCLIFLTFFAGDEESVSMANKFLILIFRVHRTYHILLIFILIFLPFFHFEKFIKNREISSQTRRFNGNIEIRETPWPCEKAGGKFEERRTRKYVEMIINEHGFEIQRISFF